MAPTATDTTTKPATFIAKCENLILVMEPSFPKFNHLGLKIGNHPGKRVEFEKYQFTSDDPEVIEWLREHPANGVPTPQGFYELGKGPDEPQPTIPEQREAIESAAAAGSVTELERLIAEEQDTHNRDEVLAAARIALVALAGGGETPANDVRDTP